MWSNNDKRWLGVGCVFFGVAILIVFVAWRARENREDQALVDARWRQFIVDAKTTDDFSTDNRFDCDWMHDVLNDEAPSIVLTPGATPVPITSENWPSNAVAREYLAELC